MSRISFFFVSLLGITSIVWLQSAPNERQKEWQEIEPDIFRTTQIPHSYAIISNQRAILIDASVPLTSWTSERKEPIEKVLLTQHHRGLVRHLHTYLDSKIPVHAMSGMQEFLAKSAVEKFWQESIPLRNSRTGYFVPAIGFEGIQFDFKDGDRFPFQSLQIQVMHTPGPTPQHTSYFLAQNGKQYAFVGSLVAGTGKIPFPFTTDWDHWTDAGLKAHGGSLDRIIQVKPTVLLPSFAEPISEKASATLQQTKTAVQEVGFLKSFERFSDRLGNSPAYEFLVPAEQVGSAGDKPWSKVSPHCFITGNTYVLVSKINRNYLVIDPWGQRSIDRLRELVQQEKLGVLERVVFSHAHYDHFDGVYLLPKRESFEVWGLDLVSRPLAKPFELRAPFLDARPIHFDRTFRDGDTVEWGGYSFRVHDFPGQSRYTMALETVVDDKKVWFTADNFFHRKQYSGSGGWMGLNRSTPRNYALSAAKVLQHKPDWILAEHGGPYVFHSEDYQQRVQWGEAGGKAADQISISGVMEWDWDPYRVETIPYHQTVQSKTKTIKLTLEFKNALPSLQVCSAQIFGRGLLKDHMVPFKSEKKGRVQQKIVLQPLQPLPLGRHVFTIGVQDRFGNEMVDAWFCVDVQD